MTSLSKFLDDARGRALSEWKRLPDRLKALEPKSRLDWIASAVALWVFVAWFMSWYRGNHDVLWDPMLQPDDARTALFPFHRYSEGAPLADDPIANEMLEYQPYAHRLLFRLTVPFVGLLAATKIVQALLFVVIAAGGVVLATSRRAGLGAGLLFTFLFLHDISVQERVLGGLPRGFGFPVCALWLAGALANRRWVRYAAAGVAALTYPTGLAMVLGAEGVYALRGFARPGFATLWRRLRHFALLVAACVVLLAPALVFGMSDGGPIHTLEEAQAEPAFGKTGRLRILPFDEPSKAFGDALLDTFRPLGTSPAPGLMAEAEAHEAELQVALVALLLFLVLARFSAPPGAVLAFLISSLVLYALSRWFAFKLYSPERYYSVGMRVVGLGLAAAALGFVAPRLSPSLRQPLRSLVAAAAIGLVWLGLGNGVREPHMGYDIDYRRDAKLWDYIRTMPLDTRIATHLLDGDNIPLFGMRANNGGFETLQPWLTKSWARQKARSEDTFRALYATKHEEVIAFAEKYRVTHFMVNDNRYRDDFASKAKSFEPFSTFTRQLLSSRRREELVLANPPPEAVVFRYGGKRIVSVAALKRTWNVP
ncbi:MAG TPA: hypothetical protein VFZ53_05485 [Polyangiaceae bacterium]